MTKMNPRIAIVLFPWASSGPFSFISEMIEILTPITESLLILTGGYTPSIGKTNVKVINVGIRAHYTNLSPTPMLSKALWIAKSILFQLSISMLLLRNRSKIDIVFMLSHPYESLPLMLCKLLRIRTVEFVTRGQSAANTLGTLSQFSQEFAFHLSYAIAVETTSQVNTMLKEVHRKKVVGEAARFIDKQEFNCVTPIQFRKNVVAYIGRLREEKGIIEFVRAIPRIVGESDAKVLIVGSGDQSHKMDELISSMNQQTRDRIELRGWVPKDEIGRILNEIKILVLPSSSEGLPTISLQAMATGTILIATRVGGFVDLISEGVNGFYLANGDSDSIERRVLEVLKMEILEDVSRNAMLHIDSKYSLEDSIIRYQGIIENVHNR